METQLSETVGGAPDCTRVLLVFSDQPGVTSPLASVGALQLVQLVDKAPRKPGYWLHQADWERPLGHFHRLRPLSHSTEGPLDPVEHSSSDNPTKPMPESREMI